MPYNANYSVTQSIDCATITIADISSNPDDEMITDRKLYLQKADGTYIAPASQTILVGAANATAGTRFRTDAGLPSVGTIINISFQDPVLGFIYFYYEIQSGDTDIPTISQHFVDDNNEVNDYTFTYDSVNNFITITAPTGYGSSINYSGSGTGIGFLNVVNIAYQTSTKQNFAGGSYGTEEIATG